MLLDLKGYIFIVLKFDWTGRHNSIIKSNLRSSWLNIVVATSSITNHYHKLAGVAKNQINFSACIEVEATRFYQTKSVAPLKKITFLLLLILFLFCCS